jgi:drug/metabolite transporter (DMT)-like permease
MVEILLLYALCASSFTISKAVLAYSPPIFFVGVRMVAAGFLLCGYLWLRDSLTFIARKDWLLFLGIVFFHIYFAYIFDLWSLQYMTSFKSAFFFNLSPFITAIFSYFIFGELMTVKKYIGMIIGFIGFLPMLLQQASQEALWGELLGVSWPEIVLFAGVVSSCLGWIIMRKLLKHHNYSPMFVNGVGMVFGGLLCLVTSYLCESWQGGPVTNWVSFISLTSGIIIACNFMFYNFYGHLLRYYTATMLSFAGSTTSLFAALYGFLFLGETVTWHFFASSLIVSIGLYIFYQEELQQGYIG